MSNPTFIFQRLDASEDPEYLEAITEAIESVLAQLTFIAPLQAADLERHFNLRSN